MPINVLGYAARSQSEPLGPHRFERRDLRPDDVVIEILFCGVCHSDVNNARNTRGRTTYPLVPGHEIVGRVESVGPKVTTFKPGDRVGVGCLVDSCRHCQPCRRGEENYCDDMVLTYNSIDPRDRMRTYGGFSQRIVVTEDFVVRIPDGLELKGVAPLLCAGVTTWSPLRRRNVGKGTKLGVIGLGGLGHLALRFGRALGAHVTLFTRSPSKVADGHRFGADRVVMSTDAREIDQLAGELDLIIDTVPSAHDINPYVSTLAIDGTLVIVGYMGAITPSLFTESLVLRRKSVTGSLIGGIAETQEMLEFCGTHGITAQTELIEMAKINGAFDRMLQGDVRYRFVIDLTTLRK